MSDKTYIIPVSNGILEARHRKAIGPAIWLFLWMIDRSTANEPAQDGERPDALVLNGRPITVKELADELGESLRTIRYHLAKLIEHEYIRVDRIVGSASSYTVRKSRKKFRGETDVIGPDLSSQDDEQQPPTAPDAQPTPQANAADALHRNVTEIIFPHFLAATARKESQYRLTPKRREQISRRLRERTDECQGDTEKATAEMLLAIDGIAASDFHMGRKPETAGKKYNDLDNIFRSYEKTEDWINKGRERQRKATGHTASNGTPAFIDEMRRRREIATTERKTGATA